MTDRMREEATFTASLRYGEVNTDTDATTAGDRSRLTLGLNFRPIETFVFKNELLLQSNGADGSLGRPFTSDWEPETRYVSSAAFMF